MIGQWLISKYSRLYSDTHNQNKDKRGIVSIPELEIKKIATQGVNINTCWSHLISTPDRQLRVEVESVGNSKSIMRIVLKTAIKKSFKEVVLESLNLDSKNEVKILVKGKTLAFRYNFQSVRKFQIILFDEEIAQSIFALATKTMQQMMTQSSQIIKYDESDGSDTTCESPEILRVPPITPSVLIDRVWIPSDCMNAFKVKNNMHHSPCNEEFVRDLIAKWKRASRSLTVQFKDKRDKYIRESMLSLKTQIESLYKQKGYLSKREEQEVVPWMESVECRSCKVKFGLILSKRHHCRLCGESYCRLCLVDHELEQDANYSILMCKACEKKMEKPVKAESNELEKFYKILVMLKSQLESQLQLYKQMLTSLQKNYSKYSEKAATLRKHILDLFVKFDTVGKKILQIPFSNETEAQLCSSIYRSVNQFLQNNMFTLQFVPKEVSSTPESSNNQQAPIESPSAFISMAKNLLFNTKASVAKEDFSEIINKLQVLYEQKQVIETTIQTLLKQRKLDDVQMLRKSLVEIEEEIVRLENVIQ